MWPWILSLALPILGAVPCYRAYCLWPARARFSAGIPSSKCESQQRAAPISCTAHHGDAHDGHGTAVPDSDSDSISLSFKSNQLPSSSTLRKLLRQSIACGHLRRTGPIKRLEKDGTVPPLVQSFTSNLSHAFRHPVWGPPVEMAVKLLNDFLGKRLLSVLLRGSIPLGRGKEAVSDLDLLVIFEDDCPASTMNRYTSPTAKHIRSLSKNLTKEFRAVSKVEFAPIPITSLSALEILRQRHQPDSLTDAMSNVIFSELDREVSFLLATSSICVHGVDVSKLLPRACSRPHRRLQVDLPSVVQEALEASQHASGDPASASRPLRWALKRCLRAAAEVRAPDIYTRDLAMCALVASKEADEIRKRQILAALLLATHPDPDVVLTPLSTSILRSLSDWVSTQSVPQPLTLSEDDPRPSLPSIIHTRPASILSTFLSPPSQTPVAAPTPLSSKLYCSISSNVPELTLEEAIQALKGPQALKKPVIIRDAIRMWRAVNRWTPKYLAMNHAFSWGLARVSPSLRFTFCEETHPWVVSGRFSPPAKEVGMQFIEFADRLKGQEKRREAGVGTKGVPHPEVYKQGEYYYWQSTLTEAMMRDIDLKKHPLFKAFGNISQMPRLWLSGTVTCACVNVCGCVCVLCVCMCACMCVYMCVCVCVCECICANTWHTNIFPSSHFYLLANISTTLLLGLRDLYLLLIMMPRYLCLRK